MSDSRHPSTQQQQQQQQQPPPAPATDDLRLIPFIVGQQAYLRLHPELGVTHLATESIVIDRPARVPRVLLLQRAAESAIQPGCWQVPGGLVDDADATILDAAMRNLHATTSLRTLRICAPVGEPERFALAFGQQVASFRFSVQLEPTPDDSPPAVRLNPAEHQRYVWASEYDVRVEKEAGGVRLRFTARGLKDRLLLAFAQWKVHNPATTVTTARNPSGGMTGRTDDGTTPAASSMPSGEGNRSVR